MQNLDVDHFDKLAKKYHLNTDQYSIFWALATGEAVMVTAVPRALMETYIPEVFIIRPFSRFGLMLYRIEPVQTNNAPPPSPFPMSLDALARWARELAEARPQAAPQARGLN